MTESWRRFLRFCAIGAIGFVVDGGILQLLTAGGGWDNLLARVPSFLTAVFVTWLLNRSWTFGRGRRPGNIAWPREFLRYLGIGFGGHLLNLAIYGVLVVTMLSAYPLAALAIASIAAMLFTYFSYSRWVFPAKDTPRRSSSDKSASHPTRRIS